MTNNGDEFDHAAQQATDQARRRVLLAMVHKGELIYRRDGTYLGPGGEIITKLELKRLTDA